MPPSQPLQTSFPSSITLTVTPPPAPPSKPTPTTKPTTQPPSNVVLLLHGLGDTHTPFTTLATSLSLPSTTSIALQAPTPLPFSLAGYHWGDDITFSPPSSSSSANDDLTMDLDTGFEGAMRLVVRDVIRGSLMAKCGFRAREVLFWGFGQGGMVALAAAVEMWEGGEGEMGGVICVGGYLPSDKGTAGTGKGKGKCKTPVLLLHGNKGSRVSAREVERVRERFEYVEVHVWGRAGDGMPRSREEMMPIMRFFARRLRSRAGVPEGSVEVG